jgi:hypothetical protein
MVALSDIEQSARLIAAFVRSIERTNEFVPQ